MHSLPQNFNTSPRLTTAEPLNIYDLIAGQAESRTFTTALLSPGYRPMSYGQLFAQMKRVGKQLRKIEIGRRDRVAAVIPDGPEMTAAFVSISAFAPFAPLNPTLRASEFEIYLTELQPKVLVLEHGTNNPSSAVARSLGIPVIELVSDRKGAAGAIELIGIELSSENWNLPRIDASQEDDVALVLRSSGTTARQKFIPLKHRNVCTSAHAYRPLYHLTSCDRVLNMMPLFHTHGLITAALSTLASGGSVVCTRGLLFPDFFDWLVQFQPTWYPAVPTLHQEILSKIEAYPDRIRKNPLRFVHSGSAPMPIELAEKMEDVLRLPVTQGYGNQEITTVACLTPLPLNKNKRGSVGRPVFLDVAVVNEQGASLPPGQMGEVVLGGDLVEKSFEAEARADPEMFLDGRFRTGDVGFFDEDGYLFLTGRVKEIINRGGEKIIPSEVEKVLLAHPAVSEAISFAITHKGLGEEVAAAVVLRDGCYADEKEIQRFSAEWLADFKVPRRVIILDELPKTPIGKIKRKRMAEILGLSENASVNAAEHVEPRNDIERKIACIWSEVLGIAPIGMHDNFFDLGGDSIKATQIMSRMYTAFLVNIPFRTLLEFPTVEEIAILVSDGRAH